MGNFLSGFGKTLSTSDPVILNVLDFLKQKPGDLAVSFYFPPATAFPKVMKHLLELKETKHVENIRISNYSVVTYPQILLLFIISVF